MHRRAPHVPVIALAGVLIALLAVTGSSGTCLAATLCGTVRDAQSLQPVPGAAVFLFDPLDQYTGLHAGTDLDGRYCIGDIPNGTYTLQVRVDDHLAAVVRDIVVEDATSVDVRARMPVFLGQPWPNPATNGVTFGLASPNGEPTTLEVFDARGRLVMGWTGSGTGNRTMHWNLRDADGSPVASGIYLVRLRAGGNEAVRRFVRLR